MTANALSRTETTVPRRPGIPRAWRRVGSVVGFVALWYVVAHLKLTSPLFLPPPDAVLDIGLQLVGRGELQRHVLVSLTRIFQGFTAGSLVGIFIGILMGQVRTIRLLLRPSIELIRPIPALVWIPLVLIWFGIGESGKIFLIAYGVFFIVVTNTFDGVQSVDRQLIRAAQSLGANPRQIFLYVLLPAALPQIATGLSLAVGTAFSVLVAAELLAATAGLGWMITDARRFFRTDIVLLGMALIGLIGFTLVSIVNALQRRFLSWHASSRA
ncbi:MAG: ABC transporter permease [Ardenticatenaceae bacterium]|nr:ABC transporter permease [Ardenticatenaceae bacterium]HBY95932.1 hypothetical protein [Chloroflexota bacterium]